jgi:ATP citrate (pro-S)-lyase
MARKKVREYDAKRLLRQHLQRLALRELPIQVAQVTASTEYAQLLQSNPWLGSMPLVVKPDMLFGQRGKHDLVGLKLDWAGVENFVKARLGRAVTVNGCTGPVTTFIVEPFVQHTEEYYLAIQVGCVHADPKTGFWAAMGLPLHTLQRVAMCLQSNRLDYTVSFSPAGGVNIEENWDKASGPCCNATWAAYAKTARTSFRHCS